MNKARKAVLRFAMALFLCVGAFGLTYAQQGGPPAPPGAPQAPGTGNPDGTNTLADVKAPIDSPIAIGALLVLGSGLAVVLLYKKRKADKAGLPGQRL